jgi:ATP-dependent DNA ligase
MALDLEPQLSQLSRHLPAGAEWVYEPKWDGFRALLAHLSQGSRLVSRRGNELGSHYPELLEAGRRLAPGTVLDGEIVAFVEGGLDFGALQYRLTMQGWRAAQAASQRPVSFVAFDLLRVEGEDVTGRPLRERRRRLERLVGGLRSQPLLDVTPQTESRELAARWLLGGYMAAGIDGVVAKRAHERYRPGERAWIKVKGERTVEAVVRGYIGGASRPRLVLGLYAEDGNLYGFGSTHPLRESQAEPLNLLEPLRTHSEHPILNRWQSQGFEGWTELPPELVVEVSVTHVDHGRLRHSAHFRRWRFDVDARSCTADQLRLHGGQGGGEEG